MFFFFFLNGCQCVSTYMQAHAVLMKRRLSDFGGRNSGREPVNFRKTQIQQYILTAAGQGAGKISLT